MAAVRRRPGRKQPDEAPALTIRRGFRTSKAPLDLPVDTDLEETDYG
jgi:hypothetical protein